MTAARRRASLSARRTLAACALLGACLAAAPSAALAVPPAAPIVTGSDPASPAASTTPKIRGTAAAGTTVRIYTNAACSGEAAGVGTDAEFASPGIGVVVAENTVTFFYANASNGVDPPSACSMTPTMYVQQPAPPPAPVFADSDPDSPANDNMPFIKGTAVTGIVRLYANAACTGARFGEGTSASFASPGLQSSVLNDATTTLYATVTNPAGSTSACSASALTYVEDSTAPQTTIDSGPPASAGNPARKPQGWSPGARRWHTKRNPGS